MAWWKERGKNHSVFVYYIENGKQKTVGRAKTQALDKMSSQQRDEWVARWSKLNEVQKIRPDLTAVPNDWQLLIDEFETHLKEKNRNPKTIKDHRRHLETSLPFFVSHGCKTFADFPTVSRDLGEWLRKEAGKTSRRIHAINLSLKLFWTFLAEEKDLTVGSLRLRGGVKRSDETPLKFTITPEDILKFNPARLEVRFFTLVGYFFSLRPQEILALKPSDFIAGSKATELDASKAMADAGLYNKLAVFIDKQLSSVGETTPKSGSKGWVTCFNEQAAKEIVAILRQLPRNERVIKVGLDRFLKVWKEQGIPKTVTKDLRRASLYWLGHYSKTTPIALKNHARHKNIETTMLYVRRPEDERYELSSFDLDA
jgi:integrase